MLVIWKSLYYDTRSEKHKKFSNLPSTHTKFI